MNPLVSLYISVFGELQGPSALFNEQSGQFNQSMTRATVTRGSLLRAPTRASKIGGQGQLTSPDVPLGTERTEHAAGWQIRVRKSSLI